MTQVMQALLTIEQAAQRLNTTERQVLTLLQRRELVGLKVGKEWRIDPADLNAYIEEQKRKLQGQ